MSIGKINKLAPTTNNVSSLGLTFYFCVELGHRRTQDFTMERVQVMGAGPGGLGDGSPPEAEVLHYSILKPADKI